jgi:hypothetical protein
MRAETMSYTIEALPLQSLLPAIGRADVAFTSRFQLKR